MQISLEDALIYIIMSDNTEIRVLYDPCWGQYGLHILGKNPQGYRTVAVGITMTDAVLGNKYEPAVHLSAEAMQLLMNELWREGLRPTVKGSEEAEASAQRAHLQDLRNITYKLLEIDK